MSFPIINDEQIKNIKPNSNTTINEKRTETINQLTKACFGYFGTPREDINQQWESNCFLLDGKWGSGKSWTLDVIEAWIKKDEFKIEIEIKENVQFLKFSAWQYLDEKELFYKLWNSVYSTTIFDPQYYINSLQTNKGEEMGVIKMATGVFDTMIKAKERIGAIAEFTSDKLEKIVDFYDKASGFCTQIPIVSDMIPILRDLKKLKSTDELSQKLSTLIDAVKKETTEEKIDLLVQNSSIVNLIISKPTIVVIDDLDRVHEDKLWRILTLLSLFDKQANLVFICVGSSEYLIKILDAKYHVKHEGENFLTKFFAREFQLKQDSYLELLVNEFVPETEWAEVLEFLNLFVDIPTYREYKTRYLQPLMEMKEDTTKNVNSVEFIITQFLQIKYANILHLLKSKNYSDLKSEIEKIIDSKNEKVQNLGLLMTAILIGMNTSIMISYTGWKGNKPKELQTSSSTVHNINIGLKKHAIDDGYILEFLYSMNFRRINYDLNFKFLEFLHS